MKTKSLQFLKFFFFGALISCAPRENNPYYNKKDVNTFRHITVIEPLIEVYDIDSEGKNSDQSHNDSISAYFENAISKEMKASGSSYLLISSVDKNARDSLHSLLKEAFNIPQIDSVRVPENVLHIGKTDILIFNYISGFSKSKSVRRKENLKTFGFGLLTLGAFIPVYVSCETSINSIVIDKKNRSVLYRSFQSRGEEYSDPKTIKYLANASIVKYFDVR